MAPSPLISGDKIFPPPRERRTTRRELSNRGPLLYRYALCEVAGKIDVGLIEDRHVVGK